MILERIQKIMKEQFDIETVRGDMKIREDFGLDSIGILELVLAIEEEFDMKVDDDKMNDIITINDVVAYIEKASK